MNARTLLLPEALTIAAACFWATTSAVGTGEAGNGKWVDVVDVNNSATWPMAMHAVHVPSGDGKIIVWGLDPFFDDTRVPMTWTPDPDAGELGALAVVNTVLITGCAGHAGLPDGSVLVAGGIHSTNGAALAAIFEFGGTCPNPPDGPWCQLDPLTDARYYPTLTTLPDGRVLVTGGTLNVDPCFEEGNPTVYSCEIFNPATVQWEAHFIPPSTLNAPCAGAHYCTYPWMFLMPNGNAFLAGGTQGSASWELRLNLPTPDWFCVDDSIVVGSNLGAAVIYQRSNGSMEVLKCGGFGFGDNGPDGLLFEAERINLSAPAPLWASYPDMIDARADHNLVLLPDGKILAVGGHEGCCCPVQGTPPSCPCYGACGVQPAEWTDPDETLPHWFSLASMTGTHGHHSTAVLLRDGSVFVAGGDPWPTGDGAPAPPTGYVQGTYTAEVFKPPYLFNANDTPAIQPLISFAPSIIHYGASNSFNMRVSGPQGSIGKVTLVRLGATTHAFDQNQRLLRLGFQVGTGTQTAHTLRVTPPDNENLAPPGYYMLFAVTNGGVPSIAQYVRLN